MHTSKNNLLTPFTSLPRTGLPHTNTCVDQTPADTLKARAYFHGILLSSLALLLCLNPVQHSSISLTLKGQQKAVCVLLTPQRVDALQL
jgi:hypothetical protein